MTRLFILGCIVLVLSAVAMAQETEPASASSTPTVLVLPVAPPSGQQWVGRSIQQDMLADLTQMTRAKIIAPAAPSPTDSVDALRAGREERADYVVWAQAQGSGDQLRVIGEVLDVRDGKALSPINATAPMDELFPLEDALAVQVARALPRSLVVNVPSPQAQPSGSPASAPSNVAAAPPGPLYESVATPSPEYYSSPAYASPYPYVYSYPDYYPGYWGWGWWGPGVIIVPHHWHDHDFDDFHHGWDNRPFFSPHVHPGFHGGFGSGHIGGGEHASGSGGHAGVGHER